MCGDFCEDNVTIPGDLLSEAMLYYSIFSNNDVPKFLVMLLAFFIVYIYVYYIFLNKWALYFNIKIELIAFFYFLWEYHGKIFVFYR